MNIEASFPPKDVVHTFQSHSGTTSLSTDTPQIVIVSAATHFGPGGWDTSELHPYNFFAFELDEKRLRGWASRTEDMLPNEQFRAHATLIGAWNSFDLKPLSVVLQFYEGHGVNISATEGEHFTNGFTFCDFEEALDNRESVLCALGDQEFEEWVRLVAVHQFQWVQMALHRYHLEGAGQQQGDCQ